MSSRARILPRRDARPPLAQVSLMDAMHSYLPIVVFSCVDGALDDLPASSSSAATRALRDLTRENVAIVLCSSKTRAELELIQQELGVQHPFICENGGAAFVPRGYFGFDVPGARDFPGFQAVEFGRSYADVVATLHRTAERLRVEIIGFSDMSIEQVARECQLPILRARLAKLREYEEPFRILDPSPGARNRLVRALEAASLRCVRRSGYDHVGAAVDASISANLLCALYRQASGPIRTAALGTMTDETLLRLMDRQVVFDDDAKDRGPVDIAGWAETMVDLVEDLRRVGISRSG